MTSHEIAPPEVHEPPATVRRVLTVGLIGVGLTVSAFVLGFIFRVPTRGFDPHGSDGVRVILAGIGMVFAGSAASMRPRDWLSWLPLGAAGLLCYGVGSQPPAELSWMALKPQRSWYAAVPNAWDSYQLLGGVTGLVAFAAAGFTRLPIRVALSAIFVLVAFYFTGIIASVLSPPPTPFLVDEYWRRLTRFHSQFLYINNAYHFYSPEPGPPSELWVCLKYAPEPEALENGGPAAPETEWVYIPRRNRDTMDPMRITYYRRIALCDQVAQMQQGYNTTFPEELQKANLRRLNDIRRIPKGNVPENQQYVQPADAVIRQTLPSFANHFAKRYGKPGREVTSVKIYRVLHEVLPVERFRQLAVPPTETPKPTPLTWGAEPSPPRPPETYYQSPYHPSLYYAYYQGEYDLQGNILDSTDPELYWLVPVERRANNEGSHRLITAAEFDRYFIDYVSVHAGSKRPKE